MITKGSVQVIYASVLVAYPLPYLRPWRGGGEGGTGEAMGGS